MFRIWNVVFAAVEFAVKTVIIGFPVLSWVGYFWELGAHFMEAPAPLKILLFFVVFMLTLPLLVIGWVLYRETNRLDKWVAELVDKEGLSYRGLSGRELGRLIKRFQFPGFSYVSVNKFGWWLFSIMLPWALIFTFGAGRASSGG